MYNHFEEKKNNAELKRLLYVAVTRAKDELYITSSIKKDTSLKKDSFINLLAAGLRNNFSSDEIVFSYQLETLKNENKIFVNKSQQINLKIPITTDIKIDTRKREEEVRDVDKSQINIASLHSLEKGEIISASKVSIYNQCPLKYLLTYEYGFGKFNSDYLSFKFADNQKNQKYFSGYDKENDVENDGERFETFDNNIKDYNSALYGRLFHKAMEKSFYPNQIEDFLNDEFGTELKDGQISEKLLQRLQNDLKSFSRSKLFSLISLAENYKNEFEIYVADHDYFLHGVIDKIIFKENKILIYDYKTDDIEKKEIKKHAGYYLMQLKFYLYIASKLFGEFDSFEGSLVFVKYPDDIVTLNYNKSQLKELEDEITNIIKSIRLKNSEKNIKHCKVCSFSGLSNKCIIN
jgi:ATP-dependent helicase/nuclease subunit A